MGKSSQKLVNNKYFSHNKQSLPYKSIDEHFSFNGTYVCICTLSLF